MAESQEVSKSKNPRQKTSCYVVTRVGLRRPTRATLLLWAQYHRFIPSDVICPSSARPSLIHFPSGSVHFTIVHALPDEGSGGISTVTGPPLSSGTSSLREPPPIYVRTPLVNTIATRFGLTLFAPISTLTRNSSRNGFTARVCSGNCSIGG